MYSQFEEALLETFSHSGITKDERATLLNFAERIEIDNEDYRRLRSKVFDLASEQGIIGYEWLEDAMKILDRAKAITYTSRAYFSPENSGQDELKELLLSARKAIWACVFTISDDELANALIKKHREGVNVKVISDNDKVFDRGSGIFKMKDAGIPVKVDDTRHHMHHKFAIVDHEILVNGSYNWTRSADEYNHENLIITKDEALVKDFSREYKRLWNELLDL
ncbi:MAG: phospholipase D-like domain-containing protein [Bacteroidia bacterium]